jgi:hypothetical protein
VLVVLVNEKSPAEIPETLPIRMLGALAFHVAVDGGSMYSVKDIPFVSVIGPRMLKVTPLVIPVANERGRT